MSEFSKSITVMSEYVQNVFGQFDVHAKKIEKAFHVSMILRDDKLKVSGEEKDVEQAVHVLIQLFAVAARGTAIDEQKVDYTIVSPEAIRRFQYFSIFFSWFFQTRPKRSMGLSTEKARCRSPIA